jgi:hypothetical protein
VELHAVPQDGEPARHRLGDDQSIEGVIGQILNFTATDADKMVMHGHIGVEAAPVVPIVDRSYEFGVLKRAEGVIDGIPRDHGVKASHLTIQVFGGRMAACLRQRSVDSRPLRSQLQSSLAKPSPYFVVGNLHVIPS